MINLLDFKERKLSEGDISFTLLPVTKAMQAGYVSAAFGTSGANDYERQVALTDYILTDCIKDLKVGGVEYDAKQVAECANLMDIETAATLKNIYVMAQGYLNGLSDDDEKKSE